MNTFSPLRYPGGKSSLAGLLAQVRSLNRLGQHSIAEPFAGGAGAALTLLFREDAPEILINDADGAIFSFWWTIVNRPGPFISMLKSKRVSMAEWRRQRAVYRCGGKVSRLRRGFATFYLNRCNRSGIIMNGGPIGGVDQRGKWNLGARYNRNDLIDRCKRVAEYKDRIRVSGVDGLEFIERLEETTTMLFIDPPYFQKGPSLYLNALTPEYHEALAIHLRDRSELPWVLTYDDCSEIRDLYSGWASIRPYRLRYTASKARDGGEVMITPPWMRLPSIQRSRAVSW